MKLFFKRQDGAGEEAPQESVPTASQEPEEVLPPAQEEALPEAPEIVSPPSLVAGAFLNNQWEILQLARRGAVNFYQATDGDFSSPRQVQIAQQQAAETCFKGALETTLWQPLDTFTQDDCDYAVFADSAFRVLSDWREASNDERYLTVLQNLVEGLCEWEEQRLVCGEDDLWGVDADSHLHYYGFLKQEPEGVEWDYDALLRAINQRLLRQVFAPAATMRLDDPWSALPFCVETIDLIRGIQEEQISLRQSRECLEELAPAKALSADAVLQTDVGQERELNEDSGAILHLQRQGQLHQNEVDFWIVADGMGGHEGGEVASDLTVTSLQQQLLQKAADINWGDNAAVRNVLFEIVHEVNRAVYELAANHGGRTQPGSTLVAAVRVGRRMFVVNVGDSRAYLWSERRGLTRVSKDHSYVQSLIDRGEISVEEAFGHPQGNVITAHIGMKKLAECDVFLRYALPGDRLLLVSDGVVDMLREDAVTGLMETPGAASLCQTLVNAANEAGGADNITALVADFTKNNLNEVALQ